MRPEKILQFTIIDEIAGGPHSVSYLAKDDSSGAKVFVRTIEPGLFASAEEYDLFRHNMENLLQLEHPNVARLLACCHDSTNAHIVREFIEGKSLQQLMLTAPVSYDRFLELASEMAHGLRAIHERSLSFFRLHGGNIFVDRAGHIKLVDFGVPLPVEDDNPYVGWSQAELEYFHLGMIFHELLSGRKRPDGTSDSLTVDLPGEARLLVKKLLATDPVDRFTCDDELVATLDEMSRFRIRSESDERSRKREPARLYLSISILTLLLLVLWIILSIRH